MTYFFSLLSSPLSLLSSALCRLPSAFCLLPSAFCLLLAAPCSAQSQPAGWADGRTVGPFTCVANFSLRSVDALLGELAQLQADLTQSLGISQAGERIELYLFRDKSSYDGYLARYFPKVPYRRALYLKNDGPGRVFAYVSREFEVDVRHECTHALLHAALPVVPLWLDEGLAEYFELPAAKRPYDNPHLGSLRWNLRLGLVPRLEELEKKGNLADMGQGEYRSAWAWVHFMLHGPREAHEELVHYLQAIQARSPPGSLSGRLQQRLPGTQRYFVAHFRNWKR